MRRQDFIDNVETWYELQEACEELGYDREFDDFYDDESMDEYLDQRFVDMIHNNGWHDTMNEMEEVPTGYDYYRINDYGEICGLDDDDFAEWKNDILNRADDDELWDAEDEEEEYDQHTFMDEADAEEETEAEFDYSALEPVKCEPDESTESVDFDGLLTINGAIMHGVVKTLS